MMRRYALLILTFAFGLALCAPCLAGGFPEAHLEAHKSLGSKPSRYMKKPKERLVSFGSVSKPEKLREYGFEGVGKGDRISLQQQEESTWRVTLLKNGQSKLVEIKLDSFEEFIKGLQQSQSK